jgi:Uma2 family endonuclease
MASILENPAIRNAALPITVEQYHQLGQAGIISQHTELLHGVILEKMVKSPEHSWLVQRLVEWLRAALPAGYHIRQEQPLTFSDSEPEPDVAVVAGDPNDFRHHHPNSAALVVEVALWSEAVDREKASVYAAAGIAEYWLVLPQSRSVLAYSQPSRTGYLAEPVLQEGDTLVSTTFPAIQIALLDLFEA